jgi:hypothetical protein
MNFTHNNHLTYTIGDRLFGYRETPYEKYKVNVGELDLSHYKKSNWLQEQYRTADIVSKEFGKDLVVLFSGGTDSEIVLRAFKHIGVKPRAICIKFKNDYNIKDVNIAINIAKEIDIDLEILEFDVKEFYYSGQAAEFAKSLQCRQIAYLTVYYNILKLQMPAIMGGEMLMRRHVYLNGSQWYYCFRENEDASAMRFSLKHNIPLVNEWFSYTPEMIAYYLEDPDIQRLITEKYNYKLASVSSKNQILHRLFPNLVEKVKTHGYEQLMGFNGETYRELYLTHTRRLESSLDGIFIDDLKSQLYGENYASSEA